MVWRGIRTKRMKYTVCGAGEGMAPWQLFDLNADPHELSNLVKDPAWRETVADLHAKLLGLMSDSGDTAPVAAAFGSAQQNVIPLE